MMAGKAAEEGDSMDVILQTLISIRKVEEKFARIQKNPALYGAENGLTPQEIETLDKLIAMNSEAMLAADAISRRILGNSEYNRDPA
jgi:hypothetical protein